LSVSAINPPPISLRVNASSIKRYASLTSIFVEMSVASEKALVAESTALETGASMTEMATTRPARIKNRTAILGPPARDAHPKSANSRGNARDILLPLASIRVDAESIGILQQRGELRRIRNAVDELSVCLGK